MVSGMTAKETIEALGGTSETAERLGVTQSAVRNWSAAGYFPVGMYLRMAALAEEEKVFLDKALFKPFSSTKLWPTREKANGKAAAEA
jgi:hypothetical protein